jgi:hypothetical protein
MPRNVLPPTAKTLMIAGAALFAVGLVLALTARLPFRIGRLPGDIVLRGKHATFYFPLMTCLLLSLAFSLLAWFFKKR